MQCPSEVQELLKVLYDLSSSEAQVLYYLCDHEARADAIADALGKDRSTVQRYLSKLRAAGLVEREGRVEDGKRGRFYVYSIPDKDEMKQRVRARLDDWTDRRLAALDDL